MKKLLFLLAFAAISTLSFGQGLPKGVLLGLHTLTVNLKEGVTMEDYTNFLKTKAVPAYEKAFSGVKMYLVRSLRGQDSSSVGMMFLMKNEAERNNYFKNDGGLTELGNAAVAKLADMGKEQEKYVAPSDAPDKYNDWLIE